MGVYIFPRRLRDREMWLRKRKCYTIRIERARYPKYVGTSFANGNRKVCGSLSLSLSLHRMATSLVSFNDQRCAQVGGLYRFLGGKRRGFPLPPRICASRRDSRALLDRSCIYRCLLLHKDAPRIGNVADRKRGGVERRGEELEGKGK